MNLRTYRARTMGDCLAEVKKDLGKDAVILHTRTYKVGGVLGLGGKAMVEVTASDGGPEVAKRKSGNIAALRAYSASPGGVQSGGSGFKPVVDRAARNAANRNESSVAVAAPEEPEPPVVVTLPPPQRLSVVRTGARATEPSRAPATSTATESPAFTTVSPGGLSEELASLKKMVGQVLQCSRHTAVRLSREGGGGFSPSSLPDAVLRHYFRLLDAEVSPELADEVVARVRDEIPANRQNDDGIIRPAVLRAIASLIPTAASPCVGPTDGRPLTLALVGPTGVGKTTTIAKLAATYKLRQGKRVGLITSDTYRIAAVDQLRTYAEIIGLPLKVAMSPADMSACCQSLDTCDVILIDTAGRSPRDAGRVDELRQFISAAQPHQTHLVLSSVSSQSVLLEAAGRFMSIQPDHIIFTKIDEAVSYGSLITVARRVALKLSYITTGQEVPDHIEPGRADRLAELLLGAETEAERVVAR